MSYVSYMNYVGFMSYVSCMSYVSNMSYVSYVGYISYVSYIKWNHLKSLKKFYFFCYYIRMENSNYKSKKIERKYLGTWYVG